MSDDQPSDWEEVYRAALVELDAAQLQQRIEQARLAVQRRFRELPSTSNHAQERERLQDAIHMLRILSQELE